jgi:hypothetical protein
MRERENFFIINLLNVQMGLYMGKATEMTLKRNEAMKI